MPDVGVPHLDSPVREVLLPAAADSICCLGVTEKLGGVGALHSRIKDDRRLIAQVVTGDPVARVDISQEKKSKRRRVSLLDSTIQEGYKPKSAEDRGYTPLSQKPTGQTPTFTPPSGGSGAPSDGGGSQSEPASNGGDSAGSEE
ncbi:MAG: hypothetical protein DRJ65_08350 [Acidobacteria bacterium]|nr:MAG: hypothetical protein DRJ65_08350 [Acidobacteriota bacterium]